MEEFIEVDDLYILSTDDLTVETLDAWAADQTETDDLEDIEALLAECDPVTR